jgi:hypothetical protein
MSLMTTVVSGVAIALLVTAYVFAVLWLRPQPARSRGIGQGKARCRPCFRAFCFRLAAMRLEQKARSPRFVATGRAAFQGLW